MVIKTFVDTNQNPNGLVTTLENRITTGSAALLTDLQIEYHEILTPAGTEHTLATTIDDGL